MENPTPIQLAVQAVGTQKGLADALTALHLKGIDGTPKRFRQSHVFDWIKRGYPPAEVCAGIEHLTSIRKERLRPDVFAQKVAS